MKKITITLFAAFLALSLSAQETFTTDDVVLNAGAGFGWYGYGYGATSIPAITLSLDKGIKEIDFGTIGIGGIVGYKHASYNWLSGYDWSWTDYIIAARGSLHADIFQVDNLDTYGGIAVGIRAETWKYFTYDPFANVYGDVKESTIHPLFAFYIGGRYYFSDNFAAFGELGYGLGYLTLGVSYKL
ncbi:MAG: hypothetical protein RBS07_10245 [Lentimicrobium sp.]|jgi:hypothetical protein|nr:hypothetical protein [Lentimicrobium sp.]